MSDRLSNYRIQVPPVVTDNVTLRRILLRLSEGLDALQGIQRTSGDITTNVTEENTQVININQADLPAAVLITSNTTISDSVIQGIYDVDASLGDVTIILPTYAVRKQFTFRKINTSGGNVYIVSAGSDTISGDTTVKLCGACKPETTVYSAYLEWGLK